MKRYILADGKGHYIRYDRPSGKYVQVGNKNYAGDWPTFEQAERIRMCCLGKSIRHRYYTITVEVEEKAVVKAVPAEPIKEDKKAPPVITELIKTVHDANLENRIIEILTRAEQILSKKEALSQMLSSADKEISDLQHYIEKKNLNARDGYKVYKKLQSVLIRRRSIKDEQIIVDIIEECRMEKESIQKAIARLNGLSGREYEPRVLTELFDKGVV